MLYASWCHSRIQFSTLVQEHSLWTFVLIFLNDYHFTSKYHSSSQPLSMMYLKRELCNNFTRIIKLLSSHVIGEVYMVKIKQKIHSIKHAGFGISLSTTNLKKIQRNAKN